MAVLKITSTNPNLSHVLQKNPATQNETLVPFSKSVASGNKVHMWFENPQYVIAMYVANANSKESNLDFSQYSDGRSYLLILDNILRTAYSKDSGYDTSNFETTVQFSLYNHREIDLSVAFSNVVRQVTKNKHTVITIKDTSVKKALETVALLSIQSCLHEPGFYIQDGQLSKYFEILVKYVTNYGVLRSFVSSIRSPNLFNDLQDTLNKTPFKFQLVSGFRNRRTKLTELFKSSSSTTIYDLGCGRGQYFKSLAKHYDVVNAVELDEEEFKGADRAVKKFQLVDKVFVHNENIINFLDNLKTVSQDCCDVLLTEVLEHIEKDVSYQIVKQILDLNVNKAFLTVPNKSFNQFYGLEDHEVRHDDHLWEPTEQETKEFFDSILKDYPSYSVQYSHIGDSLRDDPSVHTTTLIVISKV